jgi:hypothetical protein
MSDSRQVSRLQIDQITYGISSLDQARRDLVRQHLYALHDRGGGTLYKEGIHRELVQLLESDKISEIEFHDVERAFFG